MRFAGAVVLLVLAGCGADRPPPPDEATRLYLAGDGEAWIVDVARERARHLTVRRIGPGDERFAERPIAAYRLGAERARLLRVAVGDFYGMAAL